jgi:hypothetical protein
LNPSWRHSLGEVYVNEGWEDGANATVIRQAVERLQSGTDVLEAVSTDSGSYLNEVWNSDAYDLALDLLHFQGSPFERDFRKAYYGPHYQSLREIKQKYDPASLFVVTSGVASDEWDKDLTCPR